MGFGVACKHQVFGAPSWERRSLGAFQRSPNEKNDSQLLPGPKTQIFDSGLPRGFDQTNECLFARPHTLLRFSLGFPFKTILQVGAEPQNKTKKNFEPPKSQTEVMIIITIIIRIIITENNNNNKNNNKNNTHTHTHT